MTLEDVLRETITRAEKIRYQCVGVSSSAECIMYIKSNNELMIIHDSRTIFHTTIPDFFEVHPDITYSHFNMKYNDKKEPILDDLSYLHLDDIVNLKYCHLKYKEYIEAAQSCKIVACQDDLKDNVSFQLISGMRAGDGLKYFQVFALPEDRTMAGTMINIPYFVGLYGIKKADKFGIVVYDFDINHFLVRIVNKKPKMNPIDIYMCILKGV